MFKSRVFSTANVAVVLVAAVLAIQLLGMSLLLEQSWHWSTIATGLAIAPGPVLVMWGRKSASDSTNGSRSAWLLRLASRSSGSASR
jgi:archaellin